MNVIPGRDLENTVSPPMYPSKYWNTYQHKLHQHIVIDVGARTPIDTNEKMPIQSGPKTTQVHAEHKIPIRSGPKTTPVNAKHKIPIQSGPKVHNMPPPGAERLQNTSKIPERLSYQH